MIPKVSFFAGAKHVLEPLKDSCCQTCSIRFIGNQKMVLNEDLYREVRQVVLEKLGDHARSLVKDIEI